MWQRFWAPLAGDRYHATHREVAPSCSVTETVDSLTTIDDLSLRKASRLAKQNMPRTVPQQLVAL
jgi:hypothetical protein